VCYTSYTAISVGYGWTSTVNPMSNNHIDSNDVHHYALMLGDAGGIYTLSNQGQNSTMNYNYVHDFFPVAWADNGIQGIYLDEQTSGYSVIGNVFVNAVGDQTVHHNQSPNNTESNNAGTSATTIANAGIEAAYRDIKNFNLAPTCPVAISAPGLIQKTASIPVQPKITLNAHRLTIDAMGQSISRVEIVRLDGQSIPLSMIRGSRAVSNPLTPGVYLVHIQAGERTFKSKIAVTR
jgi:hypothetical protein